MFRENIVDIFNSENGGNYTIQELVSKMPKQIQNEVLIYVYKDAINTVWFLKKRAPNFYQALLPHFTTVSFKQGQTILKPKMMSNEIYFCTEGRILNATTMRIFPAGSMFGEVDVLLKRERVEKIIAH